MHQVVPTAMQPLVKTDRPEALPTTSLRWTVHPAADDPLRAATLVAALGVASTLAFEYSGSALLGILGFVMLALSLRAWFLPRRYALDEAGAHESGPLTATRHLPWSDVRSVAPGRFGIYLSTLHSRSRFVRDRGLFLRTAGGKAPCADASVARPPLDRATVLRFVEGMAQPS
jgi:hypothetical protein